MDPIEAVGLLPRQVEKGVERGVSESARNQEQYPVMENLFKDSVRNIKRFYEEHGCGSGWRFLTCSRKVLRSNPRFALIDFHPGGEEIPPDHPWQSCEKGNAYLHEKWRNHGPGEAPLQIRIQRMFKIFAEKFGYRGTWEELMEKTLSGYFIPFRSPDLKKNPGHKREASDFAERIWEKILESTRPEYIICLGKEYTYNRVRKLVPGIFGLREKKSGPIHVDVGWRSAPAEIVKFGENPDVRLLGLPYSRRGQLGGPRNDTDIKHIFERFCG